MSNLKKLAPFAAALALLPGVSKADSDVITLPPAAVADTPKTCEEAYRDAWFIREMKRTDGDTNPELGEVPECKAEGKQS